VPYREVALRQNEPYLHWNMAPQVEKTWIPLCESKRPYPRALPSCETEGAECPRSLGSEQPEVGGNCAHPATTGIAETLATLEQAGRATRSGRPLLQPCWEMVAAITVVRYHKHQKR
jgi:hypothetical protein